jgi:predicted transcriptional regulator
MKQADSSIIIVRNVCVLTSASMIVYLFFTRSWSAIIGPVQILCHAHIICITVLENRIICWQIFCDLLLKSAFEWIFNVMQLILVKIKWHMKWKYLIQKFHDICKQADSSIIIVRNVCVLTSASMIVYLFFTRSWSAIIGPNVFFTRLWSENT